MSPKKFSDLQGLTVLVLRPQPQGELLCERIRHAGGHAVYFPTVEILSLAEQSQVRQAFATLDQYQHVIFTSPQAVYCSQPLLSKVLLSCTVSAIGPGTAQALVAAGVTVSVVPEDHYSSEGLLQHPAFQHVAQQKIAIICGEHNRPFLPESLTASGALVTVIPVYRRVVPSVNFDALFSLLQTTKIDIIIGTSGDLLKNLRTLGEACWHDVCRIPVVVVSERVYGIAQALGFQRILLTNRADNSALVDFLIANK